MSESTSYEDSTEKALETLNTIKAASGEKRTRLTLYREFLKTERKAIRDAHSDGATGTEVASRRSAMMDVLITDIIEHFLAEGDVAKATGREYPVTVIASGGYGRGHLNPGSDIDLQFLVSGSSHRLPAAIQELVNQTSMLMFDLGLSVSYPVRSIKEACKFANKDHQTKTTLLDARLVMGDRDFFDEFETAFFENCIQGHEKSYLNERSRDIRSRHRKYGNTIHLQEPNVKEGCGSLRDYHNLIWVMWVLHKTRDLNFLVEEGKLTSAAKKNIEEAFEFLQRVRNELHYSQKGSPGDILTLRLQGIVATKLGYPGKNILRRSEEIMRDYYRHTRNLFQHSTSLMQAFELGIVGDESSRIPLLSFLSKNANSEEAFDGFYTKNGLIYPESPTIFEDDPTRMMRYFLHKQRRGLRSSPELRKLFRLGGNLVDGNFRMNRSVRETWEEILQNRGKVASIFRSMHRVGFLGRYLPEFGQLTDLVQHEFFHRYSADEHTLRCVDVLDSLIHSENPKEQAFKRYFQEIEDPVALYVALLLHDTGRAENVRIHEDASAILAAKVCKRLRYSGDRLRLIMFLVDHHLTFWRTATTKDLMDLDTITEFADTVKTRRRLEVLHLFTYVDSNSTNDEAWNDWKASLMKQLHRRTHAYIEDRKKYRKEFTKPVRKTKEKVIKKLRGSYPEEVEAHFASMPNRYFRHRGSTSIARHIKLFHRFFKTLKGKSGESLVPVLGWETRSAEGYTLLEVAGWDRRLLLAKIAGVLAARNLNILAADVFTRDDDLVLNIFRICTSTYNPVTNEREIERIEAMITKLFDITKEEVDLESLIEKQEAPAVLSEEPPNYDIPKRVYLSNEDHETTTVMEVQAEDRIGLLYGIFSAVGKLDVSVQNARISTQAGAAIDRFFLVDVVTEEKITEPERLEKIQEHVAAILDQKSPT